MKTKEEILQEVANKHSYDTWGDLMYDSHPHNQMLMTFEAMEDYKNQSEKVNDICSICEEEFKAEFVTRVCPECTGSSAEDYANKIIPNANANDAPYLTTGDVYDYVKEAYMQGAQSKSIGYSEEQVKELLKQQRDECSKALMRKHKTISIGGVSDRQLILSAPEPPLPASQSIPREIIEQAHMAGQKDAGVDPSYYNARVYFDKLSNQSLPPTQLISDEEIDKEFPERSFNGTYLETNMGRREGAKWMRDKALTSKEKEEKACEHKNGTAVTYTCIDCGAYIP